MAISQETKDAARGAYMLAGLTAGGATGASAVMPAALAAAAIPVIGIVAGPVVFALGMWAGCAVGAALPGAALGPYLSHPHK